MSRTSKALKRLGVAGLATLTIGAGIPAFFAVNAQAATGDTIVMTPDADSASAGTCNPFTVTVKNAAGNPATSTVDIVITQRNNGSVTTADTFDVNFCTTNTTTPNQAPTAGTTSSTGTPTGGAGAANTDTDTRRGEFTPDPTTGSFTFGVIGTEPGVADILAFIDNNNDNALDTGEARDTSVKTFTAGTSADVRTLTATPKTATNFVGEQHTIFATLKNAGGDTVAGITPTADITSGPNNATNPVCTPSNNDGVSQCTYTGTQVGTDTIVVFINQTNADNNPSTPDSTGPDAGEPQDTVTKTYQTAPSGNTIDLTCGDSTTPRSGPEDCFNPISDNTEVFSALVKRADGSVASGVIVSFAVTGDTVADSAADPKPTLSTTEATTDASGIATVTLTDPSPKNPETITVTATVRGQSPTTSDDARKTFRTVTTGERFIVLTPETATTTVGTFRTFTAKVTNVNGEAVSGVQVNFSETGAGAFRNGNSQTSATTDINGIATVDVTAGTNETGTQTITATLNNTTECVKLAGDPAGSRAGVCSDSSTNTFVAASSSPPASPPTSPPGCTTAQQNLPVRFLAPQAKVNRNGTTGPTVNATALVTVTITGATPNGTVELQAYQQNHFGTANFANAGNFRTATADANGVANIQVRFSSNARARARMLGCAFGADAGFNQGASGANSNVLYVRTVITFTVTRTGTRSITIQGDSIPARPGGLIVNIQCSDPRCARPGNPNGILFQPRANQVTGEFGPNSYTFASNFQNTRVNLYAATGVQETGEGDAQNVAGRSNNRSVLLF